MHICTVCDHKYIHKGLALYQSLKNVLPYSFVLHWLCMDEIIYQKLVSLNLPGIVPYNLQSIENSSPDLRAAKNNPPSRYGDQYSQYCWACTPFFINYILKKGIPELLYADSDIFFYSSPKVIFDVMGKKSVGIHTHRFTGTLEDQPKLPDGIGTTLDVGWYNVGVMAFRNSLQGINISETWKSWLLDPNNPFYKDYGTCGDQKFIELLIPFFGKDNICVFDDEGRICHKAPWCPEDCNSNTPILFYHFSHFNFDLAAGTWKDSNNGEWNPCANPAIKVLYENYFGVIKEVDRLL